MNHQFASTQSGAPLHLAATLPTGTYTFGSPAIDMNTYDSAFIYYTVVLGESAKTATVKWQWSLDGSNWGDEPVDKEGTATSTVQPFTALIREVTIPIDTTGYVYPVRVHRMGAYLRAGIASASSPASATVSIKIIKASNYN